MEGKLFNDLKNPTLLKNAIRQFDNAVIHKKAPEKCTLALKLLIEIFRLQKNLDWKTEVDVDVFSAYVIHMCKFINDISSGDVQKFLTVICHVHRFFISKKVSADVCDQVSKYVLANQQINIKLEHSKIYWIVLVDKLTLIQNSKINLKNEYANELVKNVLKYSELVNLLLFCKESLPWLIKTFFISFNEKNPKELAILFEKLFNCLREVEISHTKMISKENLTEEIFKYSLTCLVCLHQNTVACDYHCNESYLAALKFYIGLFKNHLGYLQHFKCLHTLVPVLNIRLEKISPKSSNVISDVIEKLKWASKHNEKELKIFSSNFRKILTLSISRMLEIIDEHWKNNMSIKTQISLMQLITLIIKTLSKSNEQTMKCKDCLFQSGIHDTFLLASFTRIFLENSAKHKMDISQMIIPVSEIYEEQIKAVSLLQSNGCTNWNAYLSKIESDHHKNAVLLYSLGFYEQSMTYFEAHTNHYIEGHSSNNSIYDWDHLSRVYYNMAICQFDLQRYREALKNCYLSMAIAASKDSPETDEKYARFAFQIKAKVFSLASVTEAHADAKVNNQQNMEVNNELHKIEIDKVTIWSTIKEVLASEKNTMFHSIFSKISFGELLLIELHMYSKSWPSTLVMSGICESMQELCEHKKIDNVDHLIKNDDFRRKSLAIIAGKAVTILSMHSNKLGNEHLCGFIKSTTRFLEEIHISNNEPIVQILLANCYRALYQCDLLEKRNLGSQLIPNADVCNDPPESHRSTVHPDDACDVQPTHQYLSLSVEESIISSLLKALQLWKDAIINEEVRTKDYFHRNKFETYIEKSLDIMDVTCQTLALHGLDFHSLIAADVMYTYATLMNNRIGILNSTGFLIENSKVKQSSLLPLINKCNEFVQESLSSDDAMEDVSMMNAVFEYLLNLSVYYFNCDMKGKGIIILTSVSNQITQRYFSTMQPLKKKLDEINLSFAKLTTVKTLYDQSTNSYKFCGDCPSILASFVNAHVECSELIKIAPRGRCFPSGVRMWIESGLQAANVSFALGLPRRARTLLRSLLATTQRLLLPRRAAAVLSLLASIDLACEQLDDCRVKLDGIRYIIDEQQTPVCQTDRPTYDLKNYIRTNNDIKPLPLCTEKEYLNTPKEFEMVLDVPAEEKLSASQGSPVFIPQPFSMPTFLYHEKTCECCKCTSIIIFNIFLDVARIEASLHFKSGNRKIANTFYDSGFKVAKLIENRRRYLFDNNSEKFFNKCSYSVLEKLNNKCIVIAECQFLIDTTLLYMSENNTTKANAYNLKVFDMIKKHSINDCFLTQFVNEQKLYLMQLEALKADNTNQLEIDGVDDLGKEFSSKLMLTPEKLNNPNQYVFKTPCDNKTRIDIRKKLNSNISDITNYSAKKEKCEFVRPSIKLKLNYDDEADNNTAVSDTVKNNLGTDDVLKTPLPKLRSKRLLLLEDSATKTPAKTSASKGSHSFKSIIVPQHSDEKMSSSVRKKRGETEHKVSEINDDNGLFVKSSMGSTKLNVYQNKSRLIRSTSPGKLEQEVPKSVDKKEKRSIKSKIQVEPKANLSPDVDLVKKYSIRKKK